MQLLVSEKEAHLRANNQASFTARQRTEALAASCPQLSLFQEHWSRCLRAAPAMTLELTALGKADRSLRSLGDAPPPRIFIASYGHVLPER